MKEERSVTVKELAENEGLRRDFFRAVSARVEPMMVGGPIRQATWDEPLDYFECDRPKIKNQDGCKDKEERKMEVNPTLKDVTKKILLSVADGPEHIEIYTSENEGVVDWSQTFPAVYLTASVNGAYVKLGPFNLASIFRGLVRQIREADPAWSKEKDVVLYDENGFKLPTKTKTKPFNSFADLKIGE